MQSGSVVVWVRLKDPEPETLAPISVLFGAVVGGEGRVELDPEVVVVEAGG
ncbi:MAG: hypothetical protein M1350_07530 [Actinobacteria bacterium]|nr:hypothetical protein [Actinomycetota bacterium]